MANVFRNLCSTTTYYAPSKAIRAKQPARTTRSTIPAPWLFLLPTTPNRHRHPPISISATFKSRDTMFHRQLCIRVDCAPGVNMLQLLANRTSERGVWKGKEGVRSSTLTYNVTLPSRPPEIDHTVSPRFHFFPPPSLGGGERERVTSTVTSKWNFSSGMSRATRHSTATFLLGSR